MDLPIFERIKEMAEGFGYFVDNHPEVSEYHFIIRSGESCEKMESRLRNKIEKEFEYDKMGQDVNILFEKGRKHKKCKMSIKEKRIEDEN